MKIRLLSAALAAAFVLPGAAWATNGYFSHGYGMKAKGMGGAGVALPQDAMAAATNPAGMVLVGNRIDFGLDWFRPIRKTETVNTFGGANDVSYDASEQKNFFIPEFAYNRMIGNDMSLGVAVFGNGGMNTDYSRNITFFGTSDARSDLMQLFISPTLAKKVGNHAFGASLNFAYQRFAVTGLENFDNAFYTSSGGNVTNKGYDTSTGWGVRLGWTGQITDMVTLGATYQSKTRMSKFDKYKGLFAEQGDFDIPENYAIGIAIKANPKTTVALDVMQINYGDIKSLANPLMPALGTPGSLLGDAGGSGFGWRDQTVVKLGVQYDYSKDLTLRAGLNHGKTPIPSSETFFNMIAPATVETHLTLGATWTLANKSELTVSYMHAFDKKINGNGSIPNVCPGLQCFGGGEANLKMNQDSLGIAYGWKM